MYFYFIFSTENAKNPPDSLASSFKLFFSPVDRLYIYFYACHHEGTASWVCVIFSFFTVMLTLYGGSNVTTEGERRTRAIPARVRAYACCFRTVPLIATDNIYRVWSFLILQKGALRRTLRFIYGLYFADGLLLLFLFFVNFFRNPYCDFGKQNFTLGQP